MNSITTLLVDIEHPDSSGRLQLMCGSGFSLLRTDATGRDIYGFTHEDREYLLIPLSFAIHADNRLAMTIPTLYEEWFADMRMDGARIRFTSPHGEPLFAALPEEYRSDSGVLRIDADGTVFIIMDKADPAHNAKRVPERESYHEARRDDASASAGHSRARGHGHHGHVGCGHSSHKAGSRTPSPSYALISMSDQELADTIRKRVERLNMLLKQAAAAGLDVDILLAPGCKSENDTAGHPLLTVRGISRSL
ncbi:MAG: hypothetical protein LBD42_07350 [Desulfovibrio sp.]|jgi:hypothetical protein|nr:hypothetical protein [Desulfovibrio sp.]